MRWKMPHASTATGRRAWQTKSPRSKRRSDSSRQRGPPDRGRAAKAGERPRPAAGGAHAATLPAEAAHSPARQALDVARGPLAEAERRGQRLDTEAKTLAKLLHVDAKKLWPPARD